jgi:hypothetical protein
LRSFLIGIAFSLVLAVFLLFFRHLWAYKPTCFGNRAKSMSFCLVVP